MMERMEPDINAYILAKESLTADEVHAPIPTAKQGIDPIAVSPEEIRSLFREGAYAYSTRLPLSDYFVQMYQLQIELVKLQNWVKSSGAKIVILFEGRDAAGKGGTIKRFVENLNPRGARVVALPKPTSEERQQWYFQRYVDHLPTAGEIVLFDRSWYNRAGVERVMGYCSEEEYWSFIEQVPDFEKMLIKSGIHLFKLYLSVSKIEQARRLHERSISPLHQWKLSPVDAEAQARWDEYSAAKEDTFQTTNTDLAPWMIVKAEDKLRTRLNAIRTVVSHLDYTGKNHDIACNPDPLIVARAADIIAMDAS